jgi:hypothetical protein
LPYTLFYMSIPFLTPKYLVKYSTLDMAGPNLFD